MSVKPIPADATFTADEVAKVLLSTLFPVLSGAIEVSNEFKDGYREALTIAHELFEKTAKLNSGEITLADLAK